jgi:hypothetical protein
VLTAAQPVRVARRRFSGCTRPWYAEFIRSAIAPHRNRTEQAADVGGGENPRINGGSRKAGTELAVELMVAMDAGWQTSVNAASRRRRCPKASIDRGLPALISTILKPPLSGVDFDVHILPDRGSISRQPRCNYRASGLVQSGSSGAARAVRTFPHSAMMDCIRAASLSIANGLASTCMPRSRWPLLIAAFSA